MTGNQNHRLLLELEKIRRDINREVMNPDISELSIDALRPIITMTAEARAAYLQELIEIARLSHQSVSREQINKLAQHREAYEELRAAANALEAAIEKGYLDVVDG